MLDAKEMTFFFPTVKMKNDILCIYESDYKIGLFIEVHSGTFVNIGKESGVGSMHCDVIAQCISNKSKQ
jgi:hypothetical protein